METFLGRYKNLIVLAVILFAQIIALAIQVKLPAQDGSTRLIRLWAVAAITPFEKAVVYTQNSIRDSWQGYINLRNVRKENQQLREQIERMKLDEVRLSEDANMARRVQALLAFKEQHLDTTVAAQVIGTSGSEQSRVIYIDKGSRDGIKADMAVITPTGVVGKIVQVFPDSSQVLPINDQLSGVGAALKETRLQGILKGGSNGATTLQYIMSDEKVQPGEEVITSGGDRIFPKGLPVGKVVSVEPGKDLFLNIRVVPSARLDQLEEVLVVTKMLEKPPDTKDLGPIRAADILAERLPTFSTPPPASAAGTPATGTAAAPNSAATAAGPVVAKPSGTMSSPGTTTAAPAAAAVPRDVVPGAANANRTTAGGTNAAGVNAAGTNPGVNATRTSAAGVNASGANATGVRSAGALQNTNAATRSPAATGSSAPNTATATRPTATGSTSPNSITPNPNTGSANPARNASAQPVTGAATPNSTATVTPTKPTVKRVIVEADPDPNQKTRNPASASTQATTTAPKPVRKAPSPSTPDNANPPATQPDAAAPQR